MKKIVSTHAMAILAGAAFLILPSCGNKDKEAVQQFAEKFQGYAQENKLDSVKTVWAECTFDSVAMPKNVNIELGKPNDEGVIRVTYAPDVYVDVKVGEDKNVKVVSSHGIAAFPAEKLTIAKEAGMVDSKLDDTEIAKRMADEDFFAWLNDKASEGYDKAVTLTPGKKSMRPDPYSECLAYKLPVTVTNNTSSTLSPDDYVISYTLVVANCSDGSVPDSYFSRTIKGQEIAPGKSITVTIADSCCEDLRNPKVKLKMSREEFAAKNSNLTGKEYSEYLKEK